MSTTASSPLVLVTGVTGFIGLHVARELLAAGFRVRGTMRKRSSEAGVKAALQPHVGDDALTRFEAAELDLLRDEGWDEAMRGVHSVMHVASPVPRTPPKHEDEIIVPARDGALRALRSASAAGVSRLVLTSSVAAIVYGNDRSRTFTENDWSNLESKAIGAYEKSKTIAERAAWDFIANDETGLELVTVNPGLVLGPVLNSDWGSSGEVIKKLFDRDFPAVPDIRWALVDVRDVASAHVSAMTTPEAAGERFICAERDASMRDIARILGAHFNPQGYRVPTGNLPGFALRFFALFDKTARLALNDLGVSQSVDTSKIRRVLNWNPRDLEEMVTSMGESFIQHGIVRPA